MLDSGTNLDTILCIAWYLFLPIYQVPKQHKSLERFTYYILRKQQNHHIILIPRLSAFGFSDFFSYFSHLLRHNSEHQFSSACLFFRYAVSETYSNIYLQILQTVNVHESSHHTEGFHKKQFKKERMIGWTIGHHVCGKLPSSSMTGVLRPPR